FYLFDISCPGARSGLEQRASHGWKSGNRRAPRLRTEGRRIHPCSRYKFCRHRFIKRFCGDAIRTRVRRRERVQSLLGKAARDPWPNDRPPKGRPEYRNFTSLPKAELWADSLGVDPFRTIAFGSP